MRHRHGKPLGGRELRRLSTKARRGRYVAVTTAQQGGGFTADVRAAGYGAQPRRAER
jgi:hypothetical protein